MNVAQTLKAFWPESIPHSDYEIMSRVIQLALENTRTTVKRVPSRVAGKTARAKPDTVLEVLSASKVPLPRGYIAEATALSPIRVSNILYGLKKNGKVTRHGQRGNAKWSAR